MSKKAKDSKKIYKHKNCGEMAIVKKEQEILKILEKTLFIDKSGFSGQSQIAGIFKSDELIRRWVWNELQAIVDAVQWDWTVNDILAFIEKKQEWLKEGSCEVKKLKS